jgi:hypothetical protein
MLVPLRFLLFCGRLVLLLLVLLAVVLLLLVLLLLVLLLLVLLLLVLLLLIPVEQFLLLLVLPLEALLPKTLLIIFWSSMVMKRVLLPAITMIAPPWVCHIGPIPTLLRCPPILLQQLFCDCTPPVHPS